VSARGRVSSVCVPKCKFFSLWEGGVCGYSCMLNDGLHIAVVEPNRHRISVWPIYGGGRICEWGSLGTEPGQLENPWSILQLPDGRFVVSETATERLQIFCIE